MGSTKATVTLAKTNLFLSLAHEPHLGALSAQIQLIKLERTPEKSSPRTSLPHGFIFPLDAVVALCGRLALE